jgi:Flp pilus assembly protein TadB
MVEEWFGIGVAVLAVTGGLGVAYYAMWIDSKKRELRHRERMAMIERGLVPPAAVEGFERSRRPRDSRRSGVFMICLGVGLAVMFGLMHQSWRQVWIGALVGMFGVANLINGLLDDRDLRREQLPTARTGDPRQP